MAILVFNAGSSTLKFGVFDDRTLEERTGGTLEAVATDRVFDQLLQNGSLGSLQEITAVGHRVVHGGARFQEPTRITPDVIAEIARLSPLSPLHNPPALRMIESALRARPGIPQIAVFDTAFFSALPEHRIVYPLPYEWYSEWGIRRFGFHGISHAYCAERAAVLLGRSSKDFNVIVCHLGSGCSVSAVQNGRAIATTMGFTPLEGLMMATRSGSIDPGILFYLEKEKGLSAEQLENALTHDSGLKGISGVSGDIREVEKEAQRGNARSKLALRLYADRVRSSIGAMAVLLDRLDAVVFAGGVGENTAPLRQEVADGLRILGIAIDPAKNVTVRSDADITSADSRARFLVIHTREEYAMARHVQAHVR